MGIKKICGCGRILGLGEKCDCIKNNKYRVPTEKRKFYSSYAWKKLRDNKVKETPYCVRCWDKHKLIIGDYLQGHHLLPYDKYKHLKLDDLNVTVLCRTCNLQVGDTGNVDWNVSYEVQQYIDNNR